MNNMTRKRTGYIMITIATALGMLWALVIILQVSTAAQTNLDSSSLPDGSGSPLTLAAYQGWHGLESHNQLSPYTSTDTSVISGHIAAALDRGIAGFVMDWYGGPEAGASNSADRAFIDEATFKLLQQSEGRGFYVALMYDEGTVSNTEALTTAYTTRVISDLLYAKRYFTMPAYLRLNGQPALFVFPYDAVDPYVDWAEVRTQLGITVTLLDKDPNPFTPAHDALFDGFYAWIQPTVGWAEDGSEWGEGYLEWFYDTMATSTYTHKIAVGGIWAGFDDSQASWGSGGYMWRRCGQTWRDTWRLARQYAPPVVMIDTWNDFEEGTDIEFGIGECLTPSHERCAPLGGGQVIYTHTLANTGKFTDTFEVEARSSNAWPTMTNLTSVTLISHTSTILTVTLTVPETASVGTQDMLVITAASQLSSEVHSSVANTTTVCGCFLPAVLRDYTWRFIEISGPTEVHGYFADVYGVWAGFPLEGVTVRLYAQEHNNYWCIQPSRAAVLSSGHWNAEGHFGAVTSFNFYAVVASGDGDQLPGCTTPPGLNYITATDEIQFRERVCPYVYLGDCRAISPRFAITRVE